MDLGDVGAVFVLERGAAASPDVSVTGDDRRLLFTGFNSLFLDNNSFFTPHDSGTAAKYECRSRSGGNAQSAHNNFLHGTPTFVFTNSGVVKKPETECALNIALKGEFCKRGNFKTPQSCQRALALIC